jgi:hypothetical protein
LAARTSKTGDERQEWRKRTVIEIGNSIGKGT